MPYVSCWSLVTGQLLEHVSASGKPRMWRCLANVSFVLGVEVMV